MTQDTIYTRKQHLDEYGGLSDEGRTEACPECEGGTVTETRRYTTPPPGDEVFAGSKRAWPRPEEEAVVEVVARRRCCRCGGRGELA